MTVLLPSWPGLALALTVLFQLLILAKRLAGVTE